MTMMTMIASWLGSRLAGTHINWLEDILYLSPLIRNHNFIQIKVLAREKKKSSEVTWYNEQSGWSNPGWFEKMRGSLWLVQIFLLTKPIHSLEMLMKKLLGYLCHTQVSSEYFVYFSIFRIYIRKMHPPAVLTTFSIGTKSGSAQWCLSFKCVLPGS